MAVEVAMAVGVLAVEQPTTTGRSRHVSALIRIALLLGLLVAAATTTATCNGFFVSESSSMKRRSILHRRTTTLTTTYSTYITCSIRGAPRRRDKIVCLTTFHEPPNDYHHWEEENTNSSIVGIISNRRIDVSSRSSRSSIGVSNNNNNSENVYLDLDLDPTEQWYLDTLEDWYEHSQKRVKCPFFRRRFGDILDRIEGVVRFVLIRPYCSDSSHRNLGPLMALKPSSSSSSSSSAKRKHLPVEEIIESLLGDWRVSNDDRSKGAALRILSKAGGACSYSYSYFAKPTTTTTTTTTKSSDRVVAAAAAVTADEKGYYVTGRLSRHIYRDDCEFRSPDPDLPIRGLRKYVGVAPMLFSTKASHSKLLSLEELKADDRGRVLQQERQQQHQQQHGDNNNNNEYGVDKDIPDATITSTILRATWKMSVTINLPWKPQLSEFTGSTLYFLDQDHLIARHQETWDISVWDAFLEMMNVKKNMFRKRVAGLGVGLGGGIGLGSGNPGPKAKIKTNKCPVAAFFRTNNDPRLYSQSSPSQSSPLSRNMTVN
eukprot:CAMPEP_0172360766 /NCGR_PEP_ID=MMETSP1060-20121228/4740_1 /TAXON_ID=37318 /ORGANISM="Pseudo-nitzschia pungens, Strain cf. cingulata" /LENGTH=543 /DNA_ID=CAMNT_0013082847 /DNA_START=162 /DNA_END=1796 /DNA_ORIENTATION=-